MGKSNIVLNDNVDITSRYRAELRVYEVEKSTKYPTGIKARFALVDRHLNRARLVIDNHEPFGFHAHLDEETHGLNRQPLEAANYIDALTEFWNLTWRILADE